MTRQKEVAQQFNLKSGDKLVVPGGQLFYESDLDAVSTPCIVYFWRALVDSNLAGTSVLWNIPGVHEYGVTRFTSTRFPDDQFHTSALGYEARLIGTTLWAAISRRVFGVAPGLSKEELDRHNFHEAKKGLPAYYANETLMNPGKELNRIRNFTIGMCGA